MDAFVGELRIFAFGLVPKGWAVCDGSLLPIQQNQALYVLLGTKYGGNGTTNFGLPDLRGKANINISPTLPQGNSGGMEKVALLSSQIPAHTHLPQAYNGLGSTALGNADDNLAQLGVFTTTTATPLYAVNGYASAAPNPVALQPATIATTGASAGHENRQPYLVTSICIAVQGYFPPRS